MNYVDPLVQAGVELATLAVKGTVDAVGKKIATIKDEKNTEKLRATYDEIVSELINERSEAIRIAQSYKDEIARVKISDDDIQSLHNTVTSVLNILKILSPELKTDDFNALKELITADTLKTMQLLGFNYKSAIGEPLTELCANAIKSWGKSQPNNRNRK